MKALGLGAAGVGTTATAVTSFADLDDLLSNGQALDQSAKNPWYVKNRELNNPTTEIDWSLVSGMNGQYSLLGNEGAAYTFGSETMNAFSALSTENHLRGVQNKNPGLLNRDFALREASLTVCSSAPYTSSAITFSWSNFGFPTDYTQQPGLGKYTGTPEENSKMLRAAATFLGAANVGFGEFDRKICNTAIAREYRQIVYEDVEASYHTTDKMVIPTRNKLYTIAIQIAMSKELFRHDSGNDGSGSGYMRHSANVARYRQWTALYGGIMQFLHYLGYDAFGYTSYAFGLIPSGAEAMLTGLAEESRNTGMLLSPRWGSVSGYFSIVTDMPVAPTPPVDAGMHRFCRTCAKCAETCPTSSITKDKETTYERFDSNLYKYGKGKEVRWLVPGKKSFVWDGTTCREAWAILPGGCANCMGNCTFNTNNGAGIHDFVKGTVATTSLFNGFFARADTFYGFGLTPDDKKEEWWDMSLPTFGYNTNLTAQDGAYSKR